MNMTNENEYEEAITVADSDYEDGYAESDAVANEPMQDEKAGNEAIKLETAEQKAEQRELPIPDYIALCKKEYFKYDKATDEGWHQLRSQINSGLYLHIPQSKINLYARADLTYDQREIMKFYLYDNADTDIIESAAAYTAPEMLMYLHSRLSENSLVSSVQENVAALSNNIKMYRDDMKNLSEDMENKISEYKKKIAAYKQEIEEKNKIIEEKNAAYNKLVNENRKRMADEKKRKAFSSQVEEAAEQMFAKRMLEEEIRKSKEEEMEAKIRKEYETKYSDYDRKRFKLFSRKNKKENNQVNRNRTTYKPEQLPDDFDITSYIMSASLTSSQCSIISLAVKAHIDDSVIKQMIDNNLPAEQMKQLLSIILVKKEKEKSETQYALAENNAAGDTGDDYNPEDVYEDNYEEEEDYEDEEDF